MEAMHKISLLELTGGRQQHKPVLGVDEQVQQAHHYARVPAPESRPYDPHDFSVRNAGPPPGAGGQNSVENTVGGLGTPSTERGPGDAKLGTVENGVPITGLPTNMSPRAGATNEPPGGTNEPVRPRPSKLGLPPRPNPKVGSKAPLSSMANRASATA